MIFPKISSLGANTGRQTAAYHIYSQANLDPNMRYIQLVYNAFLAVKHSEDVSRDVFGIRTHPVSIEQEWKKNTELHASIHYARELLKNVTETNCVEPSRKVRFPSDPRFLSPLEYAEKVKDFDHKTTPGFYREIGHYFCDKLNKHVSTLFYAQKAIMEKQSKTATRSSFLNYLAV